MPGRIRLRPLGLRRTRNTNYKDRKMPKLRTHSGSKKRFRVTASGKVKCGAAGKRHGMRKRSQQMKRTARQGLILFKADGENIVRHFLRQH